MADLVIRGGAIADGKGGEPCEADVAIEDGRIRGSSGRTLTRLLQQIDGYGATIVSGVVTQRNDTRSGPLAQGMQARCAAYVC